MEGENFVFSLRHLEKWLECFIAFNGYHDGTFKKYRRIILLLTDNYEGKLDSWRIYPTVFQPRPKSSAFLRLAEGYEKHLDISEYAKTSIYLRMSFAYAFLCHLETKGIQEVSSITPAAVSLYIGSEHFRNRKPAGVSTEVAGVKHFIMFLEDRNVLREGTHCACFCEPNKSRRIISVCTDEQVKTLCTERHDLLADLRNRAAYLLALRCGLRTCDIMNLKFENFDFTSKTISIVQKKTGEPLRIPFDVDVSNALVRYILNGRRECGEDHVFVTVTGPARKITHHTSFRTETRFRDSEGCPKPEHDGLHILRRTFASNLLKAGENVSVIAAALGHDNICSVDRYLSVEDEKMRKCALPIDSFPYQGGLY
ncbi:MAG: tyrosine-type recombinase/integrase [Sphaerochaetaceae bacterium]